MELTDIKPPRVLPRRGLYDAFKRIADLLVTIVTLPLTIPLMAVCVVLIRLDSPGPAIFVQERIGKGGRRFKIYKFRTMSIDLDRSDCEEYMQAYVRGELHDGDTVPLSQAVTAAGRLGKNGNSKEGKPQVFKPVNGHQITRVGRWLRKTSIDELPQIINVLRGEMSIVGPRPNVTWEVDAYHPWHHERLEVLPGITGLAQVRGRSCIDFNSLVRYDVEYIESRGPLMDFKILYWTFLSVVKGSGAK